MSQKRSILPPYKLKKHQKLTLKSLKSGVNLCVLPTGSGKTLTAFTYLYGLDENTKCLFITENNLIDNVIGDHIKFYGYSDNILSLRGDRVEKRLKTYKQFRDDDSKDILIINYHTLVKDIEDIVNMLRSIYKDLDYPLLVIGDEIEYIRKEDNNYFEVFEILRSISKIKGFTASPIKKGLDDIYNILSILDSRVMDKDKFYKNYCNIKVQKTLTINMYRKRVGYPLTTVTEKYENNTRFNIPYPWWVRSIKPIKKEGLEFGYDREGKTYFLKIDNSLLNTPQYLDNNTNIYVSSREKVEGFKNIKRFYKRVSKYMVGFTKEDIGDVPTIKVIKKHVERDKKTIEAFKEIYKDKDLNYSSETIAEITPNVTSFEYHISNKVKVENTTILEEVLNKAKQLIKKGEKVIIFTKYTTVSDYVETLIDKKYKKIEYRTIKGGMKKVDLEEAKEFFIEGEGGRALIITTAGLRGLNLQVSQNILCIDPPNTGGDLIQLVGRPSRIGSPYKKIYLHFFLIEDSVLEDLYNLSMGQVEMMRYMSGGLMSEKGLGDKKVKRIALDVSTDSYIKTSLKNRKEKFV